jgi:hypothetical protein
MIMQRKLVSPGKEELQAAFANKFKKMKAQDDRKDYKKETILALRDFLYAFIMFLIACVAVCAPQIIDYIIHF